METEIKLSPVLAHEAAALFEKETFFVSEQKSLRMRATYYDTPERALLKAGASFRERLEGNETVYCLKGKRQGNSRPETEVRAESLDGAAELLSESPGVSLPVAAALLSKRLAPMFETDFTRTYKNALFEGSLIEISFDRGEVRRDGRYSAISEMELELKEGSESGLTALSAYIREKYGFLEARGTKASRAERLTKEEFSKMQEVNPFFIGSEMLNYCVNMGWLRYETDELRLRYYLTDEGKAEMEKRFGINFEKPCAKVK